MFLFGNKLTIGNDRTMRENKVEFTRSPIDGLLQALTRKCSEGNSK